MRVARTYKKKSIDAQPRKREKYRDRTEKVTEKKNGHREKRGISRRRNKVELLSILAWFDFYCDFNSKIMYNTGEIVSRNERKALCQEVIVN